MADVLCQVGTYHTYFGQQKTGIPVCLLVLITTERRISLKLAQFGPTPSPSPASYHR